MTKFWLFVVFAVGFADASADDLSDFSNNLATDIGPLLVLFGESMTKQYLSESTSFLDYFIFAMAPIGVITAVVSTIRVCGHSSLRAFIGRSQEGDGAIEAELCTSTSRDVCELFTKGGITRVLGRPSILELVYDPRDNDHDKAGLFLFRHYLQTRASLENRVSPGTSDWKVVQGWRWRRRRGDRTCTPGSFAPYPNLSLNVGIVKRSRWVFFAVAAVGFILQAGVIALAGTGAWILGWNLNQGVSPSGYYAPIMYVVGTALLCGGMWSCAALIGQTTQELYYKRIRQSQPLASRLLWLQPGPQVIGDQSFDPFAYIEKSSDPLQIWTSSKKNFDTQFEFYTFLAVLAVLVGYIMQFIGLRGMNAWVSLAQLGITIIMSILRGSLRMQRLSRNGNRLADKPDTVAGHELDWLAFKIPWPDCDNDSFWHITGQYEEATEVKVLDRKTSSPNDRSHSHITPVAGQASCEDLLRIRVRLAHLTGHISLARIDNQEYQKWKDDYVNVRTKALKLSAAICQAAESLGIPRKGISDVMLRIKAVASLDVEAGAAHREHPVCVTLKPPSHTTQAGWTIDSARLEAVLGLWMWSLVSNEPRSHSDGENSPAKNVKVVRIVSAGLDNDHWHRTTDKQHEMDFWLGSNAVELNQTVLTLKRQHSYGLINLWSLHGKLSDDVWPRLLPEYYQRFCGWNPVYESLRSANALAQQPDQQVELRVQTCSTNESLLDICAQELFVALTMSLTKTPAIGNATLVEDAGKVRLDNPTVSTLVKAFTGAGLGSRSDAFLCIIPALGSRLRTPAEEDMLSALVNEANAYRRESEWERAEVLLRWACQRYSPTQKGKPTRLFEKALRATGELYRWSLAQRSDGERQDFGRNGVDWMCNNYGQYQHIQEVKEILDYYQAVKEKIVRIQSSHVKLPQVADIRKQLAEALQERDRKEALYLLCLVSTGDFGSVQLQPALPLAVRNNWSEVVSSILEMKADPNSKDEDGRTAISYCAEFGHDLKPYIDRGAFLDLLDKKLRTPLSWAAEKGHEAIAKLLLEKGADIEAKDNIGQTPLLWAAMEGHEAIVKLLLEKGADIEAKDSTNNRTPLLWVAKEGHKAIVKLLLEKGANTEVKGKDDWTPLQWAAIAGHEAVIKLLLEKGADTATKDFNGRTPLQWAAIAGHEAVIKLLRSTTNTSSGC
ncbi:hypothetical protein DL771_010109 [Monosporascus sp. 5C6A]|nr:hypothetical protein DL771_010109 [Monosporascus sp. 5C6A]